MIYQEKITQIIFLLTLFAGILVSCTNELTPKRQTMSLDGEWMTICHGEYGF